ncbi:hypothetical protein Lal_00022033 [Lupinus albus]|nr:hypothetical protein Lal_00022033 [Lupinus albus]
MITGNKLDSTSDIMLMFHSKPIGNKRSNPTGHSRYNEVDLILFALEPSLEQRSLIRAFHMSSPETFSPSLSSYAKIQQKIESSREFQVVHKNYSYLVLQNISMLLFVSGALSPLQSFW